MSKLTDLTEVTTLADGDLGMVVDVSNTSMDATGTNSKVTLANIYAYIKTKTDLLYATVLGADDNYVTDAEKTVIGNTSGTNTGDNATNTQYSGLAASKADVGQTMYLGTTQVAINRASAALTLAGITLTTPDIGTPSAGTLTNCTGLPVNGIVDDTTSALGVGTLELGHASDTTIARVSAGVASIEGNNIVVNTSSPTLATVTTTGNVELGHASDTTLSRSSAGVLAVEGVVIPSISSTNTLTNKRKQPRVYSATNNASLTPEIDTYDIFHLTAMSAATTINNHSTSTPADGELMQFRFLDNGTARALTWGTNYVAKAGVSLPTTTVLSKNLTVLFEYNSNLSKWNILSSGQEA